MIEESEQSKGQTAMNYLHVYRQLGDLNRSISIEIEYGEDNAMSYGPSEQCAEAWIQHGDWEEKHEGGWDPSDDGGEYFPESTYFQDRNTGEKFICSHCAIAHLAPKHGHTKTKQRINNEPYRQNVARPR